MPDPFGTKPRPFSRRWLDLLNAIAHIAMWVEENIEALSRVIAEEEPAIDVVRVCIVKDSTTISSNRWQYDLEPLDAVGSVVTGFNMAEIANTGTLVGPSDDLSLMPPGFVALPIGKTYNGDDIELAVPCVYRTIGTNTGWWFCLGNRIDGPCEPPEEEEP